MLYRVALPIIDSTASFDSIWHRPCINGNEVVNAVPVWHRSDMVNEGLTGSPQIDSNPRSISLCDQAARLCGQAAHPTGLYVGKLPGWWPRAILESFSLLCPVSFGLDFPPAMGFCEPWSGFGALGPMDGARQDRGRCTGSYEAGIWPVVWPIIRALSGGLSRGVDQVP